MSEGTKQYSFFKQARLYASTFLITAAAMYGLLYSLKPESAQSLANVGERSWLEKRIHYGSKRVSRAWNHVSSFLISADSLEDKTD